MRIHTDHNGVATNAISRTADGVATNAISRTADGVATNAISRTADGVDVEGHMYQINSGPRMTELMFQLGAVKEVGVNGITNEALLAIIAHRINFLNAKFPCRENSLALTKVQEALMWLEKRTADRVQRGVEGEHKL